MIYICSKDIHLWTSKSQILHSTDIGLFKSLKALHSVQMFVPKWQLVAQATSKTPSCQCQLHRKRLEPGSWLQISPRLEDCQNVVENPAMLHLAYLFWA